MSHTIPDSTLICPRTLCLTTSPPKNLYHLSFTGDSFPTVSVHSSLVDPFFGPISNLSSLRSLRCPSLPLPPPSKPLLETQKTPHLFSGIPTLHLSDSLVRVPLYNKLFSRTYISCTFPPLHPKRRSCQTETRTGR